MANSVEIANLGLSQVKGGFIESLTEDSREAQICNRIYEICRDAALADVAPQWARKQVALAVLTEEVNGFDYVYAYPNDCLDAIAIYNEASTAAIDRLDFEMGVSADGNTKLILTQYEEAELIYTAKVTNTALYDLLFVEALAWKMASYLAIPLKGDDKLQVSAAQAYTLAVARAKAKTKNEGHKAPELSSSFQRAR